MANRVNEIANKIITKEEMESYTATYFLGWSAIFQDNFLTFNVYKLNVVFDKFSSRIRSIDVPGYNDKIISKNSFWFREGEEYTTSITKYATERNLLVSKPPRPIKINYLKTHLEQVSESSVLNISNGKITILDIGSQLIRITNGDTNGYDGYHKYKYTHEYTIFYGEGSYRGSYLVTNIFDRYERRTIDAKAHRLYYENIEVNVIPYEKTQTKIEASNLTVQYNNNNIFFIPFTTNNTETDIIIEVTSWPSIKPVLSIIDNNKVKIEVPMGGVYNIRLRHVESDEFFSFTKNVTLTVNKIPTIINSVNSINLYISSTPTKLNVSSNNNVTNITYTSLNTSVASINSDGEMLAHNYGITTIIVTQPSSNFYGEGRKEIALRVPSLNVPFIKQIACGRYNYRSIFDTHCIILNRFGDIFGAGDNRDGQLGHGLSNSNSNKFYQLSFPENIKRPWPDKPYEPILVGCGGNHTFVLFDSGKLYASGDNRYGQLGLKYTDERTLLYLSSFVTTTRYAFAEVINAPTNIKSIVCGRNHSVILTNTGELYTCGANGNGQLGTGDKTNRNEFTKITTPYPIVMVECGIDYTMIINNRGELYGTGLNNYGQLGLGNTTNYSSFTKITNIPSGYKCTKVASGGRHTIIILENTSDNTIKKVYGCGRNKFWRILYDPKGTQGNLDMRGMYFIRKYNADIRNANFNITHFRECKTFTGITVNDAQDIQCTLMHTFIKRSNGDTIICGGLSNKLLYVNDGEEGQTGTIYLEESIRYHRLPEENMFYKNYKTTQYSTYMYNILESVDIETHNGSFMQDCVNNFVSFISEIPQANFNNLGFGSYNMYANVESSVVSGCGMNTIGQIGPIIQITQPNMNIEPVGLETIRKKIPYIYVNRIETMMSSTHINIVDNFITKSQNDHFLPRSANYDPNNGSLTLSISDSSVGRIYIIPSSELRIFFQMYKGGTVDVRIQQTGFTGQYELLDATVKVIINRHPAFITINPTTITENYGVPFQIEYQTNNTETDVVFKSDNNNIVRVNETGLCTSQTAGKTKITISQPQTNYFLATSRVIDVIINKAPNEIITDKTSYFTTLSEQIIQMNISSLHNDTNIIVSSSIPSVVAVDTTSNQILQINDYGFSKINIRQPGTNNYTEASKEVDIFVYEIGKNVKVNTETNVETYTNTISSSINQEIVINNNMFDTSKLYFAYIPYQKQLKADKTTYLNYSGYRGAVSRFSIKSDELFNTVFPLEIELKLPNVTNNSKILKLYKIYDNEGLIENELYPRDVTYDSEKEKWITTIPTLSDFVVLDKSSPEEIIGGDPFQFDIKTLKHKMLPTIVKNKTIYDTDKYCVVIHLNKLKLEKVKKMHTIDKRTKKERLLIPLEYSIYASNFVTEVEIINKKTNTKLIIDSYDGSVKYNDSDIKDIKDIKYETIHTKNGLFNTSRNYYYAKKNFKCLLVYLDDDKHLTIKVDNWWVELNNIKVYTS